ncbi:hypothetical protein [Staphylococcus phage vB_StaM_SA1]|nr:hypothetical protein [Staphylococcus phage vB_StaM_SA1]
MKFSLISFSILSLCTILAVILFKNTTKQDQVDTSEDPFEGKEMFI